MNTGEKPTYRKPDRREQAALKRLRNAPVRVAAPSFAIPGTVTRNAHFLAPYFNEIGIVLFETEACLNYSETDLAPDLADLPVSWHVHLPLDLPWERGIDTVCDNISKLLGKVDYLHPTAYVLHPPRNGELLFPLAETFREAGVDVSSVLLENVEESDLAAVWPQAMEAGYGACLDIGHILAYEQKHVLTLPRLWEKVGMLHLYGTDAKARHKPLKELSQEGRDMVRSWIGNMRSGASITLEVFNESGLFQSAPLLADWLDKWKVST